MESWLVKKEGLVLGPYTVEELRAYVVRGKVTVLDLVSRDGETGWTSIRQVPQLRDVATEAAVPPPRLETAPAAPVRAWYVAQGNQVVGPLHVDALRAALAQGQVRFDDQACEVGATAWEAVNGIAALADLLPPPVPSPGIPSGGSSGASPVAAPSPNAPTLRLYTTRQTEIAAWTGSWIAGAILLIRNERALGRDQHARILIVATIVSVIGFLLLGALLPDDADSLLQVVGYAVGSAFALAICAYAERVQKPLLEAHVGAGGRVHSTWRVVGVTVVVAVSVLVVVVAFSPAPDAPSTAPTPEHARATARSETAAAAPTLAVATPAPAARRDRPLEHVVTWRDFTLPNTDDFLDVMAWRGFRVCARDPLHHCRLRVGRLQSVDSFHQNLQTVEYTALAETIEPAQSCETQMRDVGRACTGDSGRLVPACAQGLGVFGAHDPHVVLDSRDLFLRENEVVFECDEGYVRR